MRVTQGIAVLQDSCKIEVIQDSLIQIHIKPVKVPATEVLIPKVQVASYIVKFFHGRRNLKVGAFKTIFHVESKNRIYSGDQAFNFKLFW